MIIDPRGMDPVEWCERTGVELKRYGQLPLGNLISWQEWARQLTYLPYFAGRSIPDPQGFAGFEEWATRFNQTVQI